MSLLREAFMGILLLLLLGVGLGASLIALANLAGTAPLLRPLGRLNAAALLVAGVLFMALPEVAAGLFGEDSSGLLQDMGLTLAAGFAAWVFLRLARGRIAETESNHGYAWTVGSYLCAVPGLLALQRFSQWLLRVVHLVGNLFREEETLPPQPVQDAVAGFQTMDFGWEYLGIFVAVVLVHPLLEEVLFRGYLWRFLAARSDFGPRRALLFSTLVFTLVHPPSFWLPIFYLGMFFGWVCWRTGSVKQAIFAHMLHNGAVTVWAILAAD